MQNSALKQHERTQQYKNMLNASVVSDTPATIDNQVLKSSRIRSIINAYLIKEVFNDNAKVAYAGEQFPNEILFPFGISPLNIESMAAFYSRTDSIGNFLRLTEEYHVARDICTNVRGALGVALADCFPTPDVIMVNNHPCDSLAKLAYVMSEFYNKPYLSIEVPNYMSDQSVNYLAKQLEHVMYQLEDILGVAYDSDKFQEVITYSNEAKKYFVKTVKLTETYCLPAISKELYEIFATNPWGLKEAVQLCKVIHEEASEAVKSQKTKSMKRVLWVGQLPNHTSEIIDYLENYVEIIYWGALMDSNMFILDDEDPFRSIAKRSILYMWNTERFRVSIEDVLERFSMDGIVIVNAWGCRNLQGLSQMLRNFATDHQVKYLTVDADYMDKNNFAFSHVKNRIDAFIEIL